MRLSSVAKLVIVDNSFFHPAGERRGPVFKAELATGSDRRFGLGGGFGPSRFPPDFPERLERFREDAGRSSRGLARRLWVDNRMLRRWRTGTQPDQRHLVALFNLAAELGLLHILVPVVGEPEPVEERTV